MTASYQSFLDSWAAELDSRADRVRTLIGSKHWASDGYHKEFLIRQFLSRHLPPPVLVGHGFVRSASSNLTCSPEIDVLVTQPANHPLYFNEGSLQIAPPKSVIAAIEVKTTFASNELGATLTHIAKIGSILRTENPHVQPWLGAFFFRSKPTRTPDSVMNLLLSRCKDLARNDHDTLVQDGQGLYPSLLNLPTCICLIGEYVVFFRQTAGSSRTFQLDLFQMGRVSFALALIDLLSAATASSEPTALEIATDHLNIERAATATFSVTE